MFPSPPEGDWDVLQLHIFLAMTSTQCFRTLSRWLGGLTSGDLQIQGTS